MVEEEAVEDLPTAIRKVLKNAMVQTSVEQDSLNEFHDMCRCRPYLYKALLPSHQISSMLTLSLPMKILEGLYKSEIKREVMILKSTLWRGVCVCVRVCVYVCCFRPPPPLLDRPILVFRGYGSLGHI